MVSYYYGLQKEANDQEKGKKERRRVSLERPFSGDYMNYRENFLLKSVVASYDKNEKVVFAHAVNKYDRRSRAQRRVLLLTDTAIYIVAIERNKEKEEKAKKPWVYVVKRRLLLNSLQTLEFSKLCDNFVMLKGGDFDSLLECRRKTEFIGTVLKYARNVRINFTNSMEMMLKGNKKSKQIAFERGGLREEAKIKGGKVTVGDGLSADSAPNLRPPEALPVHQLQKEIIPRNQNARNNTATSPRGPPPPNTQLNNRALPVAKPAGFKPPAPGPGPGPSGVGRAAPIANKPAPVVQKKAAAPPAPATSSARVQVRALHDFEAENDDELSMRQGEIVTVTGKEDDNWWEGELPNGTRGKFPTNYVEVVKPAAVAKPAPTPVKPSFNGAPAGKAPPGAKPPASFGVKPMAGKPAPSVGRGRGY